MEQVSGKSHEEFLYENLLKPAGMEKTGFRRPRYEARELARGRRNGREWGTILERPAAADGPYWNLRGNGGIHSTGGDMWLWHRALEGDAILSKDAKKKFFTPYIPEDGGESQYAYGWAIFETPRRTRLIAHNGGDGIFAADDRWYPDDGLFYYIASNAELPAIAVSDRIARLCFVGKGGAAADVVMPPEVAAPAAAGAGAAGEKVSKLAGEYRLESGGRVALRASGGGLALAADSALLFGTLFPMPPQFAGLGQELAQRTQQILEASRKGDTAPLCRAIGDAAPPEQVAQREADRWDSIAKSCGAIRSVAVLGARPHGGGAVATVARIDGERATAYRSFVWEDDALADLATLDGPPEAAFLPDATGGYVAFDFWNGNTTKIAAAASSTSGSGADAGSIEIVATNPKGAPLTKLRANRAR